MAHTLDQSKAYDRVERLNHGQARKRARQVARARKRVIVAAITAITATATSALAQDAPQIETDAPISITEVPSSTALAAINANTLSDRDVLELSLSLPQQLDNIRIPELDLPATDAGSTQFNLNFSDAACLSLSENCARDDRRTDLGLGQSFLKKSDDGIDLVLKPRASVRVDDNGQAALLGAVVEIGEHLFDRSDFKKNTWYLFAGADAEALTYSPDGLPYTPDGIVDFSSGHFHLQDRIIVGDAKAGLGYRIGDADVSLSYQHRQAQANDFTYKEDAATLSFTWKR